VRESGSRLVSAASAVFYRGIRLLSVISLLATACALLARKWWFFELFSHFILQVLTAQLGLAIVMLVMRRRAWAIVLGCAAVMNALPVRDYVLPLRRAAVGETSAFRVITANVHVRNRNPEPLIELVRNDEPDVYAIVELTQRFADALSVLDDDYPYQVVVPDTGPFGIALYSRWPLHDSRVFELEGLPVIYAEILRDGAPWHIIAAHLLPPMSAEMAQIRGDQLDGLAEFVETVSGPVVLVGDLNISPYSPFFADFVLRAQLRSALQGFGPSYTWPAFAPVLGIPIDHVLVSNDVDIAGYFRAPNIGSDHFPLMVDMIRHPISLD